jgi:signal transduction histidine kinase
MALSMPIRIHTDERDERRFIVILYIATLAVLGLLLYATYANMKRYDEAVRSVRRYNLAILELTGVYSGLKDQETRATGFLITGDTVLFLEPYRRGLALDKDRFMMADSLLTAPNWNALLQVLRVKVEAVEGRLSSLMSRHVSGIPLGNVEGLRESAVAMDEMRAVHERIIDQLCMERDRYLSIEQDKLVGAPIMLTWYSALAIAATALLFWRLSRALRNTERTRSMLQVKLGELDREVEHRTSVQAMLQKVLDTSPSGIMAFRSLHDIDGKLVDFEFLTANRQASAILGRIDLVGRRLLAELPDHFTAGLFDAFEHVVRTGVPFRKDLHYKGEAGDRWFSTHAVRFEDGLLVTFADITDKKHAQEISVESDRIALTGQITRTVAHEVRNPLTNIHLAVEQLHDEVQDRDDIVLGFFQIIERNLKRIATLIDQMLESTRKRELNLVSCELEDIVHRAMDNVADRLALNGIKVEVGVVGDLPAVLVDGELIDLAITNIAVNAVEAMEPGKGYLRMGAFRMGDEVLLEISDNGKGMRPEDIGRLFEPFYSGRSGGLGLGLTTSRIILNSHRIKLEVHSKVDEGTVFTLRFPSEVFVHRA